MYTRVREKEKNQKIQVFVKKSVKKFMAHPEFSEAIQILHEAYGFVVTIETKQGEQYRGSLYLSEDNMNCQLKDVIYTNAKGEDTHMDHVFIKGSNIKFFILPDMLANSPSFIDNNKRVKGQANGYAGNLRDKNLAFKMRNKFST